MDYDKLIEQAKKDAAGSHPVVPSWAAIVGKKQLKEYATAIKTLQAENNGLKEKLYDGEGVNLVDYWMQQAKIEENGHRNCQAENEKLRSELAELRAQWDMYGGDAGITATYAELEQVKAERDAAVKDLEHLMLVVNSGECCKMCKHDHEHLIESGYDMAVLEEQE